MHYKQVMCNCLSIFGSCSRTGSSVPCSCSLWTVRSLSPSRVTRPRSDIINWRETRTLQRSSASLSEDRLEERWRFTWLSELIDNRFVLCFEYKDVFVSSSCTSSRSVSLRLVTSRSLRKQWTCFSLLKHRRTSLWPCRFSRYHTIT